MGRAIGWAGGQGGSCVCYLHPGHSGVLRIHAALGKVVGARLGHRAVVHGLVGADTAALCQHGLLEGADRGAHEHLLGTRRELREEQQQDEEQQEEQKEEKAEHVGRITTNSSVEDARTNMIKTSPTSWRWWASSTQLCR